MNRARSRWAVCTVSGRKRQLKPYKRWLDLDNDLVWAVHGEFGPHGIPPEAADLMDLAAVVYRLERLFRRQRVNPPRNISLRIPLRLPERWDDRARQAAAGLLLNLGSANWELDVVAGQRPVPKVALAAEPTEVERVVLFSGGLDSLCGTATLRDQAPKVRLASLYRKEMNLQRRLAAALGFAPPGQFRLDWRPGLHASPGRSFYYRSFLFLALGAVVARSWGVRGIDQFENGVLASAIPPAASWRMTRHAHPWTRRFAADLFGCLFGGEWVIDNPFRLRTKSDSMIQLAELLGGKLAYQLARQTETCWFLRQLHTLGGKEKENNQPCGVCIPCLIRRTALPREKTAFDLHDLKVRNEPVLGAALRDYWIFLSRVNLTRDRPAEFYRLLPADWRNILARREDDVNLADLHELFLRFYDEFRRVFHLR